MTYRLIFISLFSFLCLATTRIQAGLLSSATSAAFVVDTRAGKGPIATGRLEEITYGGGWNGIEDAEASVSVNGSTVASGTDDGIYGWTPPGEGGVFVLMHATSTNGIAVGESLTATFVVPNRAVRPSVAASAAFVVDTRAGKGPIATDHFENITYGGNWDGVEDAEATVAVNGAAVASDVGEGVYGWAPPAEGGVFVLTHGTATNGVAVGEALTAMFVVPCRAVHPSVAASAAFVVDTRAGTGPIQTDHLENITYGGSWDGIEDAEATVSVNGAAVSSGAGEGLYGWMPPAEGGVFMLTHGTMTNGVAVGECLTATFVVPSRAVRPSIAASAMFVVDTRAGTGPIPTDHLENITYGGGWDGIEEAKATVAVNGAAVASGVGEGLYGWMPPAEGGVFVLTHGTSTNGVAVGESLAATFVVPCRAVHPSVASSAAFVVDTRAGAGPIQTDHLENITYGGNWDGVEDAEATVAVNGAAVASDVGEGVYGWAPPAEGGVFVLTHGTATNGVAIGESLAATFVVPNRAVHPSVASSAAFVVDTRAGKGAIVTDHEEDITYSGLWLGSEDALTTVAMNGVDVKSDTGEGVYVWRPSSNGGIYLFTHLTTTNGVAMGEPLVARFLVVESAEAMMPAEISHAEARQRYPWNGMVDLSFVIGGAAEKAYAVSFGAMDAVGNTNLPMKAVSYLSGTAMPVSTEPLLLKPGTYKFLWDAAADLPDGFTSERVICTIEAK